MSDSMKYPREVPMSVKMQRALDALKRLSRAEYHQLLVRAGLITELEAQQALERPAPPEKPRRIPKKQRTTSAKNAPKPPAS